MSLRQPWTEKEDEILASLVNKYGTSNWILISEKFQARANTNSRTGKQCRQRWHNNLDPSITKRPWNLQEEQIMFQGHRKYGNRWAQIASELNNRTDSDVKNHFYAVIRKCLRRISKMFGQKNSTEKIKNLKPSILSRLLQNTHQKSSKQTSEALFKFILSRENLNIGTLEKKTRILYQNLIERISNIAEGGQQKVQKVPEQMFPENKKAISKRSQRLLKMEKQSERNATSLKKQQKKKQRKTKIKRSKQTKKSSQIIPRKSIEKENKEKDEQKLQLQMPEVSIDKKSSKILSVFDSLSPSVGFRWVEEFDQKETPRDRKLWIREGKIEDTYYWPDFSLPGTPSGMRLRSSNGNDMLRILSSNDQRTIYVTPKNPTPGNVQNLFPNWTISHKLTTEQIDDEREKIRKQIQRNNKEMK